MSKEVLEQVVLKASSDARFRAQLNDNFDAALRPYDLSPDEKSKVLSGIAGLGDDREVRRMMAASNASSIATASQSATAASSQATNAMASSEAATEEASSAAASSQASTVEGSSTLTS